MSHALTEATVEAAVLDWLRQLGFATQFGPDVAPDSLRPERADYADVVLSARLESALARINPDLPADALVRSSVAIFAVSPFPAGPEGLFAASICSQ